MDDTQTLDLFTPDNGDDAAPIEQHASQAYLGYAVSTVKSRVQRARGLHGRRAHARGVTFEAVCRSVLPPQ